ncbi:DUF2845 domain-containing protein [Candidatus Binatia bacterium]|nr:DUF2845 domain-containing protein [Candidatus Binatia bacterium]
MRDRALIMGICGLLATIAISADGQIMCPMGAIEVGDTQDQVLAMCGPPTLVQEWDQTRVAEADLPDGTFVEPLIVVPQPEWVYDYGPTRFVFFVRFENGVVSGLQTGNVPPPPALERDIPDA